MKFENVTRGTTCTCLHGCAENTTDAFARKTSKSQALKDAHFKSDHERGKEVQNTKDCSEICGKRGVSVDLWNEDSKDDLLNRYMKTFGIAPKYKDNLSIVKFRSGCGVIKNTPTQLIAGKFHHDLYKCDEFAIELIELVENIPLQP